MIHFLFYSIHLTLKGNQPYCVCVSWLSEKCWSSIFSLRQPADLILNEGFQKSITWGRYFLSSHPTPFLVWQNLSLQKASGCCREGASELGQAREPCQTPSTLPTTVHCICQERVPRGFLHPYMSCWVCQVCKALDSSTQAISQCGICSW